MFNGKIHYFHTISMAMFNSNLLVYQRVSILKNHGLVGGFKPSKAWGSNHRSWNHSDSGNISVYSNLVTPQEIETWTFLLPRIWRRVSNRSIFLGGSEFWCGTLVLSSHLFAGTLVLSSSTCTSRCEKQDWETADAPSDCFEEVWRSEAEKMNVFSRGFVWKRGTLFYSLVHHHFSILLPYYFHIKVAINWWLFSYPFSHNPNIVLLVISPS